MIALVCGVITAFLMLLALASSDWLQAVGWRQGLFEHCIETGAPTPLPFQTDAEPGCHRARNEREFCFIFCLKNLLVTVFHDKICHTSNLILEDFLCCIQWTA